MTFSLQPVATYPPGGAYNTGGFYDSSDIVGNELTLAGGPSRVFINLFLADWDPEGDGPWLRLWDTRVNASSYANGVGDALIRAVEPCLNSAECASDFGEPGASCNGGFCEFAWVNKSAASRSDGIQTALPSGPCATNIWQAINLAEAEGHGYFGAQDPGSGGQHCGRADLGIPHYGGSFALDVPAGAAGVYTIALHPDFVYAIDDATPDANDIPVAAVIPAIINTPAGSCCTDITPGGATCTGPVSQAQCEALPSSNGHVFRLGQSCPAGGGPACCVCATGPAGDAFCSDGNACTNDKCQACVCVNTLTYDPQFACCDPATGAQRFKPANGPCVSYECSPSGQLITTMQPVGTTCDPQDACVMDATCDATARCVGPEFTGPSCRKPRYISLAPAETGVSAIRVTLTSLHHPAPPYSGIPARSYSTFEGQHRWVGPVSDCVDSPSFGTSYKCAKLQCTPEYVDWAAALDGQFLHVTGSAVIPNSRYDVNEFSGECMGVEDGCESVLIHPPVYTSRWGDVTGLFQNESAATQSQPNILDIHAILDKLVDRYPRQHKPRTQLNGNDPNPFAPTTALDLGLVVDAVKGSGYYYAGPAPCAP